MFEAYPPCRQTVTHVLNQKHFLCLEPGPGAFEVTNEIFGVAIENSKVTIEIGEVTCA
jgi:hypothetical protein